MGRAIDGCNCTLACAEQKNRAQILLAHESDDICDKMGVVRGTTLSSKSEVGHCVRNENRVALPVPRSTCSHDEVVAVLDALILPETNVICSARNMIIIAFGWAGKPKMALTDLPPRRGIVMTGSFMSGSTVLAVVSGAGRSWALVTLGRAVQKVSMTIV